MVGASAVGSAARRGDGDAVTVLGRAPWPPAGDWPLLGAGALLLALAYPPFHLIVPSFVCVVPVVLLLERSDRDPRPLRRRLAQGFWYGFLTQGVALYWMTVALWRFTPLSLAGYAAIIIAFGVCYAGVFALTGWLTTRKGVPLWLALPTLWTALEWAVAHLGDLRFSWLGLGTSLTGFPTLVQIADVVGARGLTFALVLANVVLAGARPRRGRRAIALRVGAVAAGVLVALGYGTWRERTIALRPLGTVALIQPNVDYADKWGSITARRAVFDDLLALTREAVATGDVDLIVWPETAVPRTFPHPWQREVADLARELGIPVLAGALHAGGPDGEAADPSAGGGSRAVRASRPRTVPQWNAAFLFDSTGASEPYPVHHKRYLVPVTERVPLVPPEWLDLPFFGALAEGGPGGLYPVGMGRFGILICYESTFESLARGFGAAGADFLVNITNDAWFGDTSAPAQHLAHLTMRSIETRTGVARAANTGISAFVDPLGHVAQATAPDVRTFTLGPVMRADTRPLYVRLGDWVGVLSTVATALLLTHGWLSMTRMPLPARRGGREGTPTEGAPAA